MNISSHRKSKNIRNTIVNVHPLTAFYDSFSVIAPKQQLQCFTAVKNIIVLT